MVTGSVASSAQGEPRTTHDIDLLVAIEKTSVKALIEAFPPPDFYLDETSVNEAVARRSSFNLLDAKEGTKVDFWILTGDPFDRSRFSRKRSEEFLGIRMKVSSPEDTILAKLWWAEKSGGSEKQFTDALRVYEVQYEELDKAYLAHWTERLDLLELWRRLQAEAEII